MLKDIFQKVKKIDETIANLKASNTDEDKLLCEHLENSKEEILKEAFENLTAADRVFLARNQKRPNGRDYIERLFTDFFEQCGDRKNGEDKAIMGGIALYKGTPVTVIATMKGKSLEENLEFNFAMPSPEGYRKVCRLAQQAEKFNRPIINFVDTPGAYPGLEAEMRGQGEAIAQCLSLFSSSKVPAISIITGEGGSGGALALSVANTVIMLSNAVYSILSPEGFASILWKDAKRSDEACEIMKLTAKDLLEYKIIDYVIEEGIGSITENEEKVLRELDRIIDMELNRLLKLSPTAVCQERYKKFRQIG